MQNAKLLIFAHSHLGWHAFQSYEKNCVHYQEKQQIATDNDSDLGDPWVQGGEHSYRRST